MLDHLLDALTRVVLVALLSVIVGGAMIWAWS